MSGKAFVDRLRQEFGDSITEANLEAMDPWIGIVPEAIAQVCRFEEIPLIVAIFPRLHRHIELNDFSNYEFTAQHAVIRKILA